MCCRGDTSPIVRVVEFLLHDHFFPEANGGRGPQSNGTAAGFGDGDPVALALGSFTLPSCLCVLRLPDVPARPPCAATGLPSPPGLGLVFGQSNPAGGVFGNRLSVLRGSKLLFFRGASGSNTKMGLSAGSGGGGAAAAAGTLGIGLDHWREPGVEGGAVEAAAGGGGARLWTGALVATVSSGADRERSRKALSFSAVLSAASAPFAALANVALAVRTCFASVFCFSLAAREGDEESEDMRSSSISSERRETSRERCSSAMSMLRHVRLMVSSVGALREDY